MKIKILITAAVLTLGSGAMFAGTLAVGVSGFATVTDSNSYTTGWAFTTSQSFNVTALGYYDAGLDGLLNTHDVGIYTSGGSLLVSSTVPSGTVGTLDGPYRMVAITPFLLSAGSYVIGGSSIRSLDPIDLFGSSTTPIAGITVGATNKYAYASGLTFPSNSAGTLTYMNANFEVTGVPEPATYGLVLIALTAFGLRKRIGSH